MNRTLIASFAFLLFAASMSAQGAMHRPLPRTAIAGDFGFLDSSDPFLAIPSRPAATNESNAAPGARSASRVPVTQLRIPFKASKEFERARKAFRSGELRSSAEHLQKAVQIYPDFLDAHNALGLRFIQIGEYQKALAEHEIALSLDPGSAPSHQNVALALLLLNRYHEAEVEARQALELDSQAPASHYFLARALIGQNYITPEALQMLHQSEDAFPNASLVLAQIHFTQGHTEQVIADLRHYLQSPPDQENKQKAQCWAAQLSHQSMPSGCPQEITRPSFR